MSHMGASSVNWAASAITYPSYGPAQSAWGAIENADAEWLDPIDDVLDDDFGETLGFKNPPETDPAEFEDFEEPAED